MAAVEGSHGIVEALIPVQDPDTDADREERQANDEQEQQPLGPAAPAQPERPRQAPETRQGLQNFHDVLRITVRGSP